MSAPTITGKNGEKLWSPQKKIEYFTPRVNAALEKARKEKIYPTLAWVARECGQSERVLQNRGWTQQFKDQIKKVQEELVSQGVRRGSHRQIGQKNYTPEGVKPLVEDAIKELLEENKKVSLRAVARRCGFNYSYCSDARKNPPWIQAVRRLVKEGRAKQLSTYDSNSGYDWPIGIVSGKVLLQWQEMYGMNQDEFRIVSESPISKTCILGMGKPIFMVQRKPREKDIFYNYGGISLKAFNRLKEVYKEGA